MNMMQAGGNEDGIPICLLLFVLAYIILNNIIDILQLKLGWLFIDIFNLFFIYCLSILFVRVQLPDFAAIYWRAMHSSSTGTPLGS